MSSTRSISTSTEPQKMDAEKFKGMRWTLPVILLFVGLAAEWWTRSGPSLLRIRKTQDINKNTCSTDPEGAFYKRMSIVEEKDKEMPPVMVAAADAVMRDTLPDSEVVPEIDIEENGVFVVWDDYTTSQEQHARHLLEVQRRHMEEMYVEIERALQKGKAHGIPDAVKTEMVVAPVAAQEQAQRHQGGHMVLRTRIWWPDKSLISDQLPAQHHHEEGQKAASGGEGMTKEVSHPLPKHDTNWAKKEACGKVPKDAAVPKSQRSHHDHWQFIHPSLILCIDLLALVPCCHSALAKHPYLVAS
ncbi:unnamed protein product, partial [Mesorhabditis spiculigera]